MKVINEYVENEEYIEVLLTKEDIKKIENKKIVSQAVDVQDAIINVGVRLIQPGE